MNPLEMPLHSGGFRREGSNLGYRCGSENLRAPVDSEDPVYLTTCFQFCHIFVSDRNGGRVDTLLILIT